MELIATQQAESLKGPIDLAELARRARADAKRCQDFPTVPFRHTRVRVDGSWMFQGEVGKLSRHAFSQLCARLQLPGGGTVPAGYLARCPAHLAAEHLNHWVSRSEQEEQKVLIRTYREPRKRILTVRAVLSERYAPADHLPLLETLRDLIPRHRLEVQAWSLDDEQFTLRLHREGEHPASLKDPLRVGLHISNSEIGLGRISITALITRLVCSNGLVVKVADLGGLHRRHIGRAGESLQAVIQAGIPGVLEEADQAARRFVQLREQPAPAPLEDYVKKTVKEAELPETVVPLVTHVLEGETLYDVVNAFTRVAQRFPVAERVRIETHMSQFLRDGWSWN